MRTGLKPGPRRTGQGWHLPGVGALFVLSFLVGFALRDSSGWYRSFPRDQVKVNVHDPLSAHRELLSKLTQADVHNLFAYMETLK